MSTDGDRNAAKFRARQGGRTPTSGSDGGEGPCSRKRRRRDCSRSTSNASPDNHRMGRSPDPVEHPQRRRDRSTQRRRQRSTSLEQRIAAPPRDVRRRMERDRDRSRSRSPYRSSSHRDSKKERRRHGHGSRSRSGSCSRSRSRSWSREQLRHRDRHRDRSSDRRPHRHDSDYSGRRSPRRQPNNDSSDRRRIRRSQSPGRSSPVRKRAPLPSQGDSFRSTTNNDVVPPRSGTSSTPGAPPAAAEKQKPNFSTTGLLAREANRVEGTNISLKYNEPPEARKPPPSSPWTILIFKGPDHLSTVELWKRSCWLIGREHKVCDLVAEHPSISGQHAVVQFRWVLKKRRPGQEEWEESKQKGKVKPYIIDLESVNGTILNGEPIEQSRYVELRSGDVLKFGQSEREYVVMLPPADS